MGNLKQRYIATVTFYCYGEDAKEAFKDAEQTVEKIKEKDDNQAEIEQFHFHAFGSKNPLKLDLKDLK
jgi:hypothetical protein